MRARILLSYLRKGTHSYLKLNMSGTSQERHPTAPLATFFSKENPEKLKIPIGNYKTLKGRGLYDIWGREPRWHQPQVLAWPPWSRLGRVLLTPGLIPLDETTNISNVKITGHSPVEATLKLGEEIQTTPSWSFKHPILATDQITREILLKTLPNYF